MTFSAYTAQSIESIFKQLKTSDKGLKPDEAKRRLVQFGPNQLSAHQVTWWQILVRQFKSPFIYLLFFAVGLSCFLGEITDALVIVVFITVNAVLGFVQEFHSEKSLKLLEEYIVPEARVLRGIELIIKSSDLVPGDIVIVEAGDVIPADVRFIASNSLLVDESILTGESVPVSKNEQTLSTEVREPYEAVNIGFSGTKVVSGKGTAVVIATGQHAELGTISHLTIETKQVSSFEQGIAKFSKFILRMIVIILVILFIVNLLIKGSSANIPELVLFSIALAVGVVPEALPIVTTIAFSRGALKLAKHKVIVKRLSAIEDLGSIEILCTDKTGTLTENSLTVSAVQAENQEECLTMATLASISLVDTHKEVNNAFDVALLKKLSPAHKKALQTYQRVSELPFDPERKRNSVVVQYDDSYKLIVRGAPEVIFKLCEKSQKDQLKNWQTWLEKEGLQGRRVIAIAEKIFTKKDTTYTAKDESNLQCIGLISFVDPIKKSTHYAVEQAKRLGVEIKILTGDNKQVAGAVAHQIGLIAHPEEVLTGEELEQQTLEKQQELVKKYHVFARVSPEQKYYIIELLRAQKEVGFLGEGINDAPALKMAQVGIVVNGAALIAKEAADIVLLQNSLADIIDGIKEGRQIFSNIIKYIKLTLISNFGNFYAIAAAALILPFLPMLPIQILLLNLLSDFPMITLSLDTVDGEELRRPKTYNIREVVLISLLLGIVSTLFDFIFFAAFRHSPPTLMQTSWFMGSVLTELVLIFSIRTRFIFWKAKAPHSLLITASLIAAGITILLPFSFIGHSLFQFAVPNWGSIKLIVFIVCGYFIANESIKLLYYRFTNHEVVSSK
jgi:Mg2+-importing ATPase